MTWFAITKYFVPNSAEVFALSFKLIVPPFHTFLCMVCLSVLADLSQIQGDVFIHNPIGISTTPTIGRYDLPYESTERCKCE